MPAYRCQNEGCTNGATVKHAGNDYHYCEACYIRIEKALNNMREEYLTMSYNEYNDRLHDPNYLGSIIKDEAPNQVRLNGVNDPNCCNGTLGKSTSRAAPLTRYNRLIQHLNEHRLATNSPEIKLFTTNLLRAAGEYVEEGE